MERKNSCSKKYLLTKITKGNINTQMPKYIPENIFERTGSEFVFIEENCTDTILIKKSFIIFFQKVELS